jgi:uncharacterized protein (DUF849 family)
MHVHSRVNEGRNRARLVLVAETGEELRSSEAKELVLATAAAMGISRPGINGTENSGWNTKQGQLVTDEELMTRPLPEGCARYLEYKVQGAI